MLERDFGYVNTNRNAASENIPFSFMFLLILMM